MVGRLVGLGIVFLRRLWRVLKKIVFVVYGFFRGFFEFGCGSRIVGGF